MANTAVFGVYATFGGAEFAVGRLKDEGFRNTDISVLFPHNEGSKDFLHEKHTKASEGAAAGGGAGMIVGGALGWLAGIGALAVPGAGLFVAAGPIMAALAGLGVGGAVGGISGALIGLGVPEYEAKRYAGRVGKGAILLSVHCDDTSWVNKAEAVLNQTGAEDISSASESEADYDQTDKPHDRAEVVVPPR
ncbi:MAG TPA: DUF3341 domain-containing protein [Planctomycetota bacterium]|nr:DUF3341 domain-containing protein [Planctomycetota bacterium]